MQAESALAGALSQETAMTKPNICCAQTRATAFAVSASLRHRQRSRSHAACLVRLWKVELQKLADETGLVIRVHHYPPGTSKWNKIERRLFCYITQNWRGRPLPVIRRAILTP